MICNELFLENVTKSIKNFSLNIPTLQLGNGDIFVLIGPNGAGKTTTINCILNLYSIDHGKIIMKSGNREVDFQDYNFVLQNEKPHEFLRAGEYLKLFADIYKIQDKETRIKKLMERLNLEKNKLINEFSAGMKKKMLLAKALINQPNFLFLDEPLEGIEVETRKEIKDIFYQQSQNGCTIFITSHNLFEIEKFANKFGFIKNGRFFKCENIADLNISLEDYYLKRMKDEEFN
ncbi:MAG: ABC transporter ATP-binding protein [bacterium]